ncbi:hypothetical protein, partial [Rikenella microfusus]
PLKQRKAPIPCAERHRRAGWEDHYLILGKVAYNYQNLFVELIVHIAASPELSPQSVCFFSRSCRGGTDFSGRLMPAGHLLFGASKKEGKKLAGNAIPRVSSLCPYFDTK